jgi:uncharacterized protein HemX
MADETKKEAVNPEIELEVVKAVAWFTANQKKWAGWISAILAAVTALVSGLSYASNELSKFTNFRSQFATCIRDIAHIAETQKQRDADMVQHRKENREDFQRLENKIDGTCEGVAEVKAMLRTSRNNDIQTIKLTLKGE